MYFVFDSSSLTGDTRCFQIETVKDTIVEGDEVFTFMALADNTLDIFSEGTNEFTLTIYDDDGKYRGVVLL